MNGVLSVLLDIFRQPSIIVALISLVGLAVQRKKATDIMKGTIRTMVGFLVLAAGASVVSGALDPLAACSSTHSMCRVWCRTTKPLSARSW